MKDTYFSLAPTITPRDYCRQHKALPFGPRYIKNDGEPEFCKLSRGLFAFVGKNEYVKYGHIFGVEIVDGEPKIVQYWASTARSQMSNKPYTAKTLLRYITINSYAPLGVVGSYKDMVNMICKDYDTDRIPPEQLWWLEFGIIFDPKTGELTNPMGLQ